MSQKSTGPRTPEGKQRSSVNARKHGFSGRTLIVGETEQPSFEKFLADWENDLAPVGALENELFGQLINAAWTLRRLSLAEAALIGESQADPLSADDAAIQNKIRLFSIYQSRAERSFHKAKDELRKIQEERLFRLAVLDKRQRLPTLPRSSAVRRDILREKRLRGLQQWEEMQADIVRPMPGQTKSFMAAKPDR